VLHLNFDVVVDHVTIG